MVGRGGPQSNARSKGAARSSARPRLYPLNHFWGGSILDNLILLSLKALLYDCRPREANFQGLLGGFRALGRVQVLDHMR